MLAIVGDAKGGAHYRSRKHDNFHIGLARVQISVLVSGKFCGFWKKYSVCVASYLLLYFLLLLFEVRALTVCYLIKTSSIRMKVGGKHSSSTFYRG